MDEPYDLDKPEDCHDCSTDLEEKKEKYLAGAYKKWYVMLIGALLGLYLGLKLPAVAHMVMSAKYSRHSLDDIMKVLVGKSKIEDALSEEVLIVAYDYNTQEPRFFSKYYSKMDPAIYNVKFNEATGASSAAPTFFDPKTHIDGYGFSELLIDGGVICNDPAMYAYQMAKDMHM